MEEEIEEELPPLKIALYHFVIDGKHLGAMERGYIHKPIHGEAYWCEECAKVWAMIYTQGVSTWIRPLLCEKHEQSHDILYPKHGALFYEFPEEDVIRLPREVLKREFLLYCKRHGIE